MNKFLTFVVVFILAFGTMKLVHDHFHVHKHIDPISQLPIVPSEPIKPTKPPIPNIVEPIPGYLTYPGIVEQVKLWNQQAPELTGILSIGKTSGQKEIICIKITNSYSKVKKRKSLITGCIHGNEPHATGTIMAYIGSLLAKYDKEADVTKILDENEVYFVPVLSPDSYPNSRHVDGVDPNRDFTDRISAPVKAIQQFYGQHTFDAVMSGHTWGRVYLTPWGKTMKNCPNHDSYVKIVGEMAKRSDYRMLRACDLYQAGGGLNNPPIRYEESDYNQDYNVPIYGAELDWYYEQGLAKPTGGCFAVVCEFGTHQRIPSREEIFSEFTRTWPAFLYFLEEAPKASVGWK